MARSLRKKIVLCDSYDATTGTPSGNVVEVLLQDNEPLPKTLTEAETYTEDGRLSSADRTKARTLIAAQRTR